MNPWEIALLGITAVLALMGVGIPIAFAMAAVGVGGIAVLLGPFPALSLLGQISVSNTMSYELSVVPMFILMGNFVTRARISTDLYEACNAFLGHRRGGLAMATIMACGGFAAVCGSSIATAATFSKVSMPQMRRYGYHDSLASAAIAAGGTLGILIPPSVIMVIYGILTGTNITSLFLAGILPGIVAIGFYLLAVRYTCWRDPAAGPPAERASWLVALRSLTRVGPVLALFLLVIGGLYLGVFTPTEAAGIGAFGAFLFALRRRVLSWGDFLDCAVETARTSAALFTILIGALLFSAFMNFAGLPRALQGFIQQWDVPPTAVVLIIIAIYLVLGCFLESLSMVLLTVPIFFPVVSALGFDPVWFGVIVVMVTELSFITPPVGMNLFVIQGMVGVPLATLYRGIAPFVVVDILRVGVMVAFPWIVLVLPRLAG
ncbi:MAG: TRAP transporter large permease [Proteobacteria bacterium]|nr:TRAP transporter large permease [Pseudomonadota bacterium]